ncbi:Peroxisomal N(1)-acetyl-spermine/spermidine oxidase [Nymphon striatum]|nr:Peroxisomal N(1)-acetyl-spermine/spermidine oxidase [Nymphon striatum]KAG1667543.1 Peroxisomal N(1)-acetyl-spermine/spermidine oxidase [Nymphon striatum]
MNMEAIKVVIIGAGISGLACASRLEQHGFKNITILEARSRIGGRIHTQYFDNKAIEMGAQYIHGQINNPVYKFAEKLSLFQTLKWSEYYDVSGHHLFNLPEKFQKGVQEVCQLISDLEADISDIYSKFNLLHTKYSNKSCGSIFLENFNRHLAKETDPEEIQMKKAVFDWHLRYAIESNASDPMTTISALYYGKYEEFKGIPYTEIQDGYHNILKEIKRQILFSNFKLNCKVTKINWYDSVVNVETAECENYDADHVIVTVPLGVLKANHSELFHPNLPKEKINAIEQLGFGTVNKIYLKFDSPFWKDSDIRKNNHDDEICYNIIWMDGLNYQGRCHHDGYLDTINSEELEKLWFRYIVRFSSVLGVDDLLCVWIVGEGAQYCEQLSDCVIVEKCHDILSMHLKKSDIPLPKLIFKSQWYSDPFCKGSYSFVTSLCDSDCTTHDNYLANPYPKICFAGEATHDNMFSTTHGALLSGYREADRIYDLYK